MLDGTRWPATSALIDEACGIAGNALLVGEGPPDDIRVLFVGLYYRGQRRPDLEREYLERYHPLNEAIPRLRQLPDGHLGRCCMKTLRWGGLARISRDSPQDPHYRDEVEGPSHV